MAKLRSFPEIILFIVMTAIFGTVTLLSFVWNIIGKGPRFMLRVQKRDVRPEVLKNNQLGEHGFMRLENRRLKLHYVASGPKDKPLMLFIHGFPEFWYSWRHQLKEFRKDYRVVAFDMRGYGDSDKPGSWRDYFISELVNDVEQMITGLGYESCVLVGHDWGAVVCWYFATLHPQRVSRLVICNVPHPLAFEEYIKSSLKQFLKSWYMFFFQVPVLPELLMRTNDLNFLVRNSTSATGKKFQTPEDIEAFKYSFANYCDFKAPIDFYRAMMRYERPLLKVKVSAPTLVIWGTNDNALEAKMAEVSGKFVEDFTLRYIEGCSHWVQQEEPEVVNKNMREFLDDSAADRK